MLAHPAADMDEAVEALGETALEYKRDGARMQALSDMPAYSGSARIHLARGNSVPAIRSEELHDEITDPYCRRSRARRMLEWHQHSGIRSRRPHLRQ